LETSSPTPGRSWAVLGAAGGFVVGSVVHDFRPEVDPDEWARRGGLYCGVLGLVVYVLER
jgi:hypothetical protein